MTYQKAMRTYKKLPDDIQRNIQAAMIIYFQSAPLFLTLSSRKKRNREERYFIKLVGDYLSAGATNT